MVVVRYGMTNWIIIFVKSGVFKVTGLGGACTWSIWNIFNLYIFVLKLLFALHEYWLYVWGMLRHPLKALKIIVINNKIRFSTCLHMYGSRNKLAFLFLHLPASTIYPNICNIFATCFTHPTLFKFIVFFVSLLIKIFLR